MLDAVIFDFDYTLVDSSAGIIHCVNYALTSMGYAEETPERIRSTIGLSLPDTFAWFKGPDEAGEETFARLFVEHADRVMVENTVLFPSVPQTITALRSMDVTLAIVSTKYRHRIEPVLRQEHLREAFEVIIGGNDVTNHKPHPESLLLALRKLGEPKAVVYVGDSVTDARTAQRAGLPFVGVLSGVTTEASLGAYQPVAVISSVAALPRLIRQGEVG